MAKVKENISADSVNNFLSEIFKLEEAYAIRCFRGEASSEWALKPSILRDMKENAESNIFSELMEDAPHEFASDMTMYGKLVRAQHYGLPTRLLDVSLNPLVALYFACVDSSQEKVDGKVIVLDFPESRVKRADSDAISLISNLARLSDDEKHQLSQSMSMNSVDFRALPASRRLVQFVKTEKPYFSNSLNTSDFKKYFFVHAPKSNKRVYAQSGAFVMTGLLSYPERTGRAAFKKTHIILPAGSKNKIRKELDLLNINMRSLFPEIEFAAKYIKQRWEKTPKPALTDILRPSVFD